jgi:pimeloyl-ACP methyl ester carboxylesterase
MKLLRRTLVVAAGLLLIDSACRAQDFGFVWSEWETSVVERRGPERAEGLLLYFHGHGAWHSYLDPIPIIFTEMANVAAWDVMRINRLPIADLEEQDADILGLVAKRIAEARRNGYKKIIVAGYSRGGWLALQAATLPDVDAAIGLAPGTGSHEPAERERTRDVLAQKLAGASAKRVAAFFFADDPREELSERRAAAVRRGLQSSGSTFVVIDRPPDLHGHGAGGTGRFVRRYRDCLLQLVQNADQSAGEMQCSRSSGYAIGSDIGFPAAAPVLKLPPGSNQPFAPFLGRWEGDDENGAYLIMESVGVGPTHVIFRTGFSPPPGQSAAANPELGDYPFETGEVFERIVYKLPNGLDGARATLKSETELEYEAVLSNYGGGKGTRKIILHKRAETPADR